MLQLGVGEGAEQTYGGWARATNRNVAELPAFGTLGELRGGVHYFHSAVAGEEVDRGKKMFSVQRGD